MFPFGASRRGGTGGRKAFGLALPRGCVPASVFCLSIGLVGLVDLAAVSVAPGSLDLFGHFFGYFFLLLQLAASFLVAEHYARALCRLDEAVNEVKQGKRSWEELVFPDHLGSLGANCRALLQDLKGTERRLQDSHLETVKAMALAMEARDVSTQGHCLRVRYYARRIMESLNLEPAYREAAEAAALLHDIGKIGIPDALLLKRNELTPDEYTRVMMHVDIGAEILRPLSSLKDAVLFVRHHHERFDGSGYPDGLRGEEIPLGSRIIAVADAVDAMRSSRPYRKGLSLEKTLLELRGAKGRHLDPGLVDIAISVLLSSPSRKASEEERLERVALV